MTDLGWKHYPKRLHDYSPLREGDAMTDLGWEHYPKRLRNYDPLREDGSSYHDRLTMESKRLFTEKGSISIDVLDIGRDEFFTDDKKPETFVDTEIFEACLTTSSANREFRFYYLKPATPKVLSRSHLHIPQETLRKILTVHQVMPGFVDFLQAFGSRHNSTDSGYGGCKRRIEYTTLGAPEKRRSVDYYEICYNIKYVEKNNRLPDNPWSIRKTGIYQKFEYLKKSSTWILVQPSEQVQRRVREVFKARTAENIENSVHNPLDIHLVFLSAAAENWRWYYNSLEEALVDRTQNALHSSVGKRTVNLQKYPSGGVPFTHDFTAEFRDVQNLQSFGERVQTFLLALEANRDTITTLQRHNNQLQKCCIEMEDHLFAAVDDSLDAHLVEIAIHKRNVESLLHRVQGRSRLLYNVLDFRNAETTHLYGQKNADLAELGRVDSDLMMKMTKRATREAVAVKIVTFVALFYLPATFVATFLSANCVNFVEETINGRVTQRMVISKDFILFVAITVPLMCITLSIWYIWDRKEGDRVKEEMGENPKASGTAA